MGTARHTRRDPAATRGSSATRRAALAVTLGLALALLAASAGCAKPTLAKRPLDASPPAEQVLRVLRLAGVDVATAGEAGGTATAWLQLPSAESAADVDAGWLTAIAALKSAYPSARRYAVVLSGPAGEPLAALSWNARGARGSDAASLRSAASVTYPAEPVAPPSGSGFASLGETTNRYLDAKNRATVGALAAETSAAATAVEAIRASTPGRPAPGPDQDAGTSLAASIASKLGGVAEPSAAALRERMRSVAPQLPRADVLALRHRLSAVEAMSAPIAGEDALLAAASRAAAAVSAPPLDTGAAAIALLASADATRAPASAVRVADFERTAPLDAPGSIDATGLPGRVLAALHARGAVEPRIGWSGGTVTPALWLAYRRADGTVYWLAGEAGTVALTDDSTRGFAWRTGSAALVSADDVSRVLNRLPLP